MNTWVIKDLGNKDRRGSLRVAECLLWFQHPLPTHTHLPLLSVAVLQLCLFGWLKRTSSTFSTPEEGRFVCVCVYDRGQARIPLVANTPLHTNIHFSLLTGSTSFLYWIYFPIHFYFLSFSDGQFPIEISSVTRDHDFLDQDAIEALFRWDTFPQNIILSYLANSLIQWYKTRENLNIFIFIFI